MRDILPEFDVQKGSLLYLSYRFGTNSMYK